MKRKILMLVVALAMACWATSAQALLVPYSNGDLSATANFELSGSTLTVTLTNTSTVGVSVPTDVLTAVLWNSAVTGLTPFTAALGVGSNYVSAGFSALPGGTIGGENAYDAISFGGSNQGISNAGFGVFGAGNFPASATQLTSPPPSVDGLDFGIVGTGGIAGNANADVTGNPLVQNQMVYTLTGWDTEVPLDISNVNFIYGTSLPAVPIPPTAWLLGSGLLGLALLGRRRKH